MLQKDEFKIIVVDDNEYNLYSMEQLLKKNGYSQIILCNDGEKALKEAVENEIDLILLDVQMPNLDGFEVAKLLKLSSKTREIPIIFVTAIFKSDEFIQKGFEVGAIDYVLKPIEEFLFIKRVENYLKISHNEKSLKNANKVINSQRKKLKSIIDTINLPLYVTDFDLLIHEHNKSFSKMLSHQTKRYIGLNMIEIFPWEYFITENGYNLDIKNNPHKSISFEAKVDFGHGERDYIINKSAFFGDDGDIDGITTLYIDITDRKRDTELLRALSFNMEKAVEREIVERLKIQNIFEKIIENTLDSIVVLDENNEAIIINRAFEKLFGYAKAELKGIDFHKLLIPDEDYDNFKKGFNEFKNSGKGFVVDNVIKHSAKKRSGEIVLVEVSVSALFIDNRWLSIGIIRDISERERLEQKRLRDERIMEHNHKMIILGEMISAISHQWRQPLNIISTLIMRLKIKLDIGKIEKRELVEHISSANKQIEFMNKTIDDFRNFFGNSHKEEKFYIYETLRDIIEFLSYRLNSLSIDIKLDCYETLIIFGNKNGFKHIMLNLLNNSIDSIQEKMDEIDDKFNGAIKIDVIERDKFIEIKIFDNGKGVDSAIVDDLFSPNFTTKGEKGSGIGLYISKQIAKEDFNGTIYVGSVDVGALFVVKLENSQIKG